ncbi:phage portal protein family protein [Micromonospora sp. WMMD737]|uniref:phage portal protein family protein n=1 Tax=Micromonospora sp. WMMD737 TaxID=3404113 RepID=UPI003B961EF8
MTAPTSLIGMVDDGQYGTIVADVYEHIPALLYPASVPVYAEMRTDPRLTAIIDGYALQIRRAQWQLDGAGCRPEVTQFVADCLGLNVVGDDHAGSARRRGVSWNDHLRSALLSQVWGHYAFEMEAEIDADGRARLAVLAERIPATITAIHADPKTGRLLGIDQQITYRHASPQIPAGRLVFYSRSREGASWQGRSLLRPAYAPWLIKKEMVRVSAISNRRWGAGVPVAEALPGTNPSPAQMAEAQRLVSAARAGDQAGAATPPGFTMRIVGLSGSVPDTVGFTRFLNQEMAGSVLMPHLDLGSTETGSRALGQTFLESWTLALESEAEAIADTATRQVCVPIVDWNWGEDEPAPRVVVSGVGSRREITAESLQLLLNSGALAADPKLEAWVRREYRLPERDPNAPRPLPAGPPARLPHQPDTEEDPAGTEEEDTADEGQTVAARRRGFDPNQRRDRDGKWTRTGGAGGGGKPSTGTGGSTDGPMSDAEFAERQKMVEQAIGKARKTLSTDITHTTATGAWKPERDRLHREIAAELYAKADKVPRDGKAVIAGGLGGAGKSTVLRDHAGIDQSQYLTLNPDDVKELMADRGLIPEVPDAPDLSPMERAALVHEESSRITKLLADMAYRDRRNVIWDITMSSEGGVTSRLDALARHGYKTRGVFVDIPVEVSVDRALSRYRRGVDKYRAGKGHGGRFVPPAIIRAQKTSGGATLNREVFDSLRDRFAAWAMYDNSVTGRPAQPIGQG